MSRLLSPGDHCRAVDVPFGRGRRYEGTVIEVTDPGHIRALKQAGYTIADTAGAPASRSSGFECGACGFKAWFRTCSRCGSDCERLSAA